MQAESTPPAGGPVAVTAAMDRRNGLIFLASYVLIYLAAPVVYIGVAQAALCDKLGAGATVANLPFAAYQLGQLAPIFFSWLVPHRLERAAVVWANVITAMLLALVAAALVLPLPPSLRIQAVVLQGLIQGLTASVSQVFMYQCLNRGTTERGRARALQQTFTAGPIFAVVGSLGAQYVLNPGFASLRFPYDFVLLYGLAAPCIGLVALLSRGYRLVTVAEEDRKPLAGYLGDSIRQFTCWRPLVLLWFTYLLWNCTLGAMANVSLYTKAALGRDPKDFSGLILAIRFGSKALAGHLLGLLALRFGMRASALATLGLFAAGMIWTWTVPGYAYLLVFGLLGAGELGGVYLPNLALTLSPLQAGARNLSILTLATPASSFAPALHGLLTDRFSFGASFAFGLATAVGGLLLAAKIRVARVSETAPEAESEQAAGRGSTD